MSCSICIEKFTKQPHRKEAKCPYCDIKACTTCTQTYLIGTHEDPHCMGCRRGWTREVLDTILLTTWINGDYKKRREDILFDRERSRLPAAQIIVERRKQAIERESIRSDLINRIREMEAKLTSLRNDYTHELQIFHQLQNGRDPFATGEKKPEEERRVFIMPCPASGCRGFLSTAYKCGVCEIYVCPDCREIKGASRDTEHTCNPDTVATVQRLKRECRGCPECGTNIFKIEGCFEKDTPILLWDGTVKMSQNIIPGDILIGDDGKKRIVQTTTSGEDMLYEVKQNKGDNYVVNSKHTLVLKYSGDKTIHWTNSINTYKVQWFDRDEKRNRTKSFKVSDYSNKETAFQTAKEFIDNSLNFEDEIELLVDDYMKLDNWTKRNMMGFKTSCGIEYDYIAVDLDPYLLGLWLGDGTHSHPIIASNDYEIQKYILDWCNANNCDLVHDENYKFRIRAHGNTNGKNNDRLSIGNDSSSNCKGCATNKMNICDTIYESSVNKIEMKRNPFIELLKKYSLVNNKHIPKEYLMNSRDVRLKILAGLIDTDGHVAKEQEGRRVTISQVNKILVENIILLAKSLGFIVNVTEKERNLESIFGREPKDYSTITLINISGEKLYEIPTLLPRKKCVGSASNKDYFRTSIEVKSKGIGTYYGWSVDENKRFLHQDFTVLRNCDQMYCTNCNTPFSWISGKKITNGAIHNPHYFEYLRVTNGGVMPRNPGDIPCIANLPNAWQFQREVIRVYFVQVKPEIAEYADILYVALNSITHIQHVEINRMTTRAEDSDNTEINVRYILGEIDQKAWKQGLQQKEKRRAKKDEIRMRYEAFVGACVDIYGRIMGIARDIEKKNIQMRIIDACKDGIVQLTALSNIFNEGMKDISRRYKCQVLHLDDKIKRTIIKYADHKRKVSRRKLYTSVGEGTQSPSVVSDSESEEETNAGNVVVQT